MRIFLKFLNIMALVVGSAMIALYLLLYVSVLRSPEVEQFVFGYGFQIVFACALLVVVADWFGKRLEMTRPETHMRDAWVFGLIGCVMLIGCVFAMMTVTWSELPFLFISSSSLTACLFIAFALSSWNEGRKLLLAH